MSNSALHRIGFIPEVTYGTTPANPAFQALNITGTTLALTKSQIESEIIVPHRQVVDVRHGVRQVGGDISIELIYGAFDALLEAVFCGTWNANVLIPGTTRRSFSILRQFTDLGGSALPFHTFTGVEFNSLSLTIAPDAFVKAVFGVFGKNWAMANAMAAGGTWIAENLLKPFDGFNGNLYLDGALAANITEIQFQLSNGIEPRWTCFEDTTARPKIGRTRITGQVTAYFEDATLLTAFNGGADTELNFEFLDLEGNQYTFSIPHILPSGGNTDVQGEGDITIPIPFTAWYNGGDDAPAHAVKITRTLAP
jgi:Phage tail tube protein